MQVDDWSSVWLTAIGTGVGYLTLLVLMFVVLFILPYLFFVIF